MKLAWLTDIHLNLLTLRKRQKFYEEIIASDADMVLISGDIAVAPSLSFFLAEMATALKKPISFVLGNHDYYFDEFALVQDEAIGIHKAKKEVYYLAVCGIRISIDTHLVGIDGWYDGRYGNFLHSDVSLNDFRLIDDFFEFRESKHTLLRKMQELADRDAKHLRNSIDTVFQKADADYKINKIIVLTHIPPFPEVCKYREQPTDDDHLPFYSSKATGDVLIEMAVKYPEIEFLVLCGHTHGKAEWTHDKHSNLTIKVGGAEYHYPEIQEIIEI